MAAEKARYFLEQSIPELREFEKKKIFTKQEITAITKKRSDFELRINASGCSPNDFTRYAQYEMNVESLYRKRIARLGIRARLHYGARRIFFILDRATRKFPGEIPLWMQYIEFAKREKANGVLAKTLAAALKLHPAKPALWIYAARHAVEHNSDITEGRSYMQRGLRFCKRSKELWREYAKLEMVFVAKVFLRRKVLGIDQPKKSADQMDEDEDENMWKLPEITGEDFETAKNDKSLDTIALENADTNPALNGALAIAIFDQAMKEIPRNVDFAAEFYDLFAQFHQLKCYARLQEHVVRYCLEVAPKNAKALWLGIELPLRDVETSDPVFPGRLSTALAGMAAAVAETDAKSELYLFFASYFTQLLKDSPELDEGIRKAITASLVKYYKAAEKEGETSPELYARWVEFMTLRGKKEEAERIAQRGLERYPQCFQ
ncbi:U3 small nucleolar RNA-associated protein 6-domain-containing protein [Sphaerosporella brunnea]|uniref:U3 small nucleolar RNA-associated protein 6-domain-containing protein n=1 Tax=Sphaerosporella brunnea TaxID=1250544 RepID=A0A5J5F3N3_9PEZI|nr:U3 small nucleolar RNA-associated protein 6-domain-containing protein [Sphaerosporella brunnea]